VNTVRSAYRRVLRVSAGLAAVLLLAAPMVQAQNFGNFMNPGNWFGGSDRDRGYDDRYPRGPIPPGYGYPPYGAPPGYGQYPYAQPPLGAQPPGMQPFGVVPPSAPGAVAPAQPPFGWSAPSAPMMGAPSDAAAQQRIRELEQRLEELERRQREPVRPMRPEFPEPEFPPLRY
jgi:hypothetical protein